MKRALFAVLFVFVARGALGCSCVGPPTREQSYDRAALVFAGVVEKIEDPAGDRRRALPPEQQSTIRVGGGLEWGEDYGRRVTFRVMEWWKGEEQPRTVEIWTGYGGGDCGYPVEVGQSFLIYAARSVRNQLTMGICGRNAALICALDEVAALGLPIKSYEAIDREKLIAREQPYTTYWRECIQPAELIGKNGLKMDRHCRYSVEGTIGTNGAVRDFRIVRRPTLSQCPERLDAQVTARVAEWRFHPATIKGVPVETKLTSISMMDPRECKE